MMVSTLQLYSPMMQSYLFHECTVFSNFLLFNNILINNNCNPLSNKVDYKWLILYNMPLNFILTVEESDEWLEGGWAK